MNTTRRLARIVEENGEQEEIPFQVEKVPQGAQGAYDSEAKGGGPQPCLYGYIALELFASHFSAGAA